MNGIGGTYWTPDGPRRMPGTRVQYSSSATTFYKSQRARFVRAMRLNVARRERISATESRFWFRSARGPASTGGHWIVEATRLPSSPGGYGTPYVPAPPLNAGGSDWARRVWTKVIYEWDIPSDFKDADNCYRVRTRTRTEGPGYGASAPLTSAGFGLGTWAALPFTTLFRRINMNIFGLGNWRHCSNWPAPPIPGTSRTYVDTIATTFQWIDYRVDEGVPTTPALYQLYMDTELGSGILGPSETPFPDVSPNTPGLNPPVAGGWEYTCTCPDFTRSEGPLFMPLFPSQQRMRSWVDSNAGAEPYCKHIYAAAFRVFDQDILTNIPRGQMNPAEGLADDFYGYLRYLSAFRRQVYRARAAQRALFRDYNRQGYDAGIAARDRYYAQLNTRDALTQDRLRDRYYYRANNLPVPAWQPEVPYVVYAELPADATDDDRQANHTNFQEAVAERQAFIDSGGAAGRQQRENDYIAANPGSLQRLRLLDSSLSPALIPPTRGVDVGHIPANYDPARRVAGSVLQGAGGLLLLGAVLPGPGSLIAGAGLGVSALGTYIHPDYD